MLRYAGQLAGIYPVDPIEAGYADEIVATALDVMNSLFTYRGPDKDKVRETREKAVAEDIPRLMGGCERRLETFGDGP